MLIRSEDHSGELAMQGVVVEILVKNSSPNQMPAFDGNSLEHDSMLSRSEGHLGEFSSKYGSNIMSCCGDNGRKPAGQTQTYSDGWTPIIPILELQFMAWNST